MRISEYEGTPVLLLSYSNILIHHISNIRQLLPVEEKEVFRYSSRKCNIHTHSSGGSH